ncbi:histidine kinase [Brevibacterium sp. p3-SID960]|uniref:sensor histidine kinase n=1 Tax=Brevibacterium sp. p3-SID960 TaxID=2916063 RepID=UPI0021A4BAB7|nr:histidine kinase [Brevibacterium sp. p3-SID960]MCT1691390.1 histidine kinase [Brevibacterium sp. p3-SID960]
MPGSPAQGSGGHAGSAPHAATASGPAAAPAPPARTADRQLPGSRFPRWLRIATSILVGIVTYLIGLIISMMALIAAPWAFDGGQLGDLGVMTVLVLVPLWATVFVRHRWPWAPFIVGAMLAAGWGDCLLMLVGMFHLLIRSPRRQALIAAIAGGLLTTISTLRLCLTRTELNPYSILFIDPGIQPTGLATAAPPPESATAVNGLTIAVAVVAFGLSLGFGLLLRRTRRMQAVEAFASHEVELNAALTAELARQSERELLARELHDTLSHRLSIISLHSGALEVGSDSAADVTSTASALRREAHASLEELRHLVGGVRAGTLAGVQARRHASTPPNLASMRSLPQLIASVQATGTVIRQTIIIEDLDSAPTPVDRAAYRIVQEALTNAMKHAPGAPVELSVTASAAAGVRIRVSNPVPAAEAAGTSDLSHTGSGAGLETIRERAAAFGGHAQLGVHGGEFVVDVVFPPFNRPAPPLAPADPSGP